MIDVVAEIKADPYGPTGGMHNMMVHGAQAGAPPTDLLWSAGAAEPAPRTPPLYRAAYERDAPPPPPRTPPAHTTQTVQIQTVPPPRPLDPKYFQTSDPRPKPAPKAPATPAKKSQLQSPRMINRPISSMYGLKKPVYKVCDNGDGCLDPRLPSIDEHSSADGLDGKKTVRGKTIRTPCVRKVSLEEERTIRISSCPNRGGDKRMEFYRKAGDGLPR